MDGIAVFNGAVAVCEEELDGRGKVGEVAVVGVGAVEEGLGPVA